jgi:hypothetical protein
MTGRVTTKALLRAKAPGTVDTEKDGVQLAAAALTIIGVEGRHAWFLVAGASK